MREGTKIDTHFIEPMLLQRAEKLPAGAAWQCELKLDGFRAQAIKTVAESHLRSRNEKDFNATYADHEQKREAVRKLEAAVLRKPRPLAEVLPRVPA